MTTLSSSSSSSSSSSPPTPRRWEELLEEAYEGWGPKTSPQADEPTRKKETNLRGLFPHPGVVYPILPTGAMRIPRPGTGLFSSQNDGGASVDRTLGRGETRQVKFVVQVSGRGGQEMWGLGGSYGIPGSVYLDENHVFPFLLIVFDEQLKSPRCVFFVCFRFWVGLAPLCRQGVGSMPRLYTITRES